MTQSHPFEPFINKNSKILILGTFPSIKSFENNFYYGNKNNSFWKILSAIYGHETQTLKDKKHIVNANKLALWDMIKKCDRENSSDNNLKNIIVNDIHLLLKEYANIGKILLTSQLAFSLYKQHFLFINVPYEYIPSPSSANARMRLEDKIKAYKKALLD